MQLILKVLQHCYVHVLGGRLQPCRTTNGQDLPLRAGLRIDRENMDEVHSLLMITETVIRSHPRDLDRVEEHD